MDSITDLVGCFLVGALLLLISIIMEMFVARGEVAMPGPWNKWSLRVGIASWVTLLATLIFTTAPVLLQGCFLSISLATLSNAFRIVALRLKEGRHRSDGALLILRLAFFILPPLFLFGSVFILFVTSEARYE